MRKTKYDVCLVVRSHSASLAELVEKIGIASSDGAHDLGSPHLIKSRGKWKHSVWQLCSRAGRASEIQEHLEDIDRQVVAKQLLSDAVVHTQSEIYISIGVFSDRQIPCVNLTRECLKIAGTFGARIEIQFYFPEMDGTSSEG
jgi:hypothetical protein